jgi:chromosome segregation ATPase
METNPMKMTLSELRREFKAVSEERDQIHERVVAQRQENDELKNDLAEASRRCLWNARNLVQERADLQARIDRINLRLVGLGFVNNTPFQETGDAYNDKA